MMSTADALNRYVRRLMSRSELMPHEQAAILNLPGSWKEIDPSRDLVRPGERMTSSALVVDGLAARFDQMREGSRQFTAFHIPGDMCDLHSTVIPVTSWGIQALTRLMVLQVPHDAIRELAAKHPGIAQAFWRDTAVDGGIFAKWVCNLGQKTARARLAHLLCELGVRLEMAGLADRNAFELHATQHNIGEALGLTPVHVNRVLQRLRQEGLLSWRKANVAVHDWHQLVDEAEFDPTYLQFVTRTGVAGDKATGRNEQPLFG